LANHKKDDIMARWVRVRVEEELAKLNVHGDHELGSEGHFFLLHVPSVLSEESSNMCRKLKLQTNRDSWVPQMLGVSSVLLYPVEKYGLGDTPKNKVMKSITR
jgi:hypothetical protein